MRTRSAKPIGIALICAVLLLMAWYVEAEDFSDGRVAGTYVFSHDGLMQEVTLKRDHTFQQEDTKSGRVMRANGTWRLFSSKGHMCLSSSFIDARDSWRGNDEHEVYGIFKNYVGIVSITFDPYSEPVKAYKKLFS